MHAVINPVPDPAGDPSNTFSIGQMLERAHDYCLPWFENSIWFSHLCSPLGLTFNEWTSFFFKVVVCKQLMVNRSIVCFPTEFAKKCGFPLLASFTLYFQICSWFNEKKSTLPLKPESLMLSQGWKCRTWNTRMTSGFWMMTQLCRRYIWALWTSVGKFKIPSVF